MILVSGSSFQLLERTDKLRDIAKAITLSETLNLELVMKGYESINVFSIP